MLNTASNSILNPAFKPSSEKSPLSGLQEILLIIVIVLAIFFLPGLIRSRRSQDRPKSRWAGSQAVLTGRLRLAILVSLVWLAAAAAYLKPWQGGWVPFIYIGCGPVALSWGLAWVILGYKRRSR